MGGYLKTAAANEFCEWIQVRADVHIPHRKYQVKPHSSPHGFQLILLLPVHRNHFSHLQQKDKCSDSKVKFRQASNCWKRVLEAA